jgi:uncharacterized MAPEG superfamily protein
MQASDFGTVEFQMLWWSAALGLFQFLLVIIFSGLAGRTPWAIGPRDTPGPAFGTVGARLDRALGNFVESFALFAALVLMANAMGKHSPMSALGAQLYFFGRLLYVPVYAFGIPVLRTVVWVASYVGVILVLLSVWPGI